MHVTLPYLGARACSADDADTTPRECRPFHIFIFPKNILRMLSDGVPCTIPQANGRLDMFRPT